MLISCFHLTFTHKTHEVLISPLDDLVKEAPPQKHANQDFICKQVYFRTFWDRGGLIGATCHGVCQVSCFLILKGARFTYSKRLTNKVVQYRTIRLVELLLYACLGVIPFHMHNIRSTQHEVLEERELYMWVPHIHSTLKAVK